MLSVAKWVIRVEEFNRRRGSVINLWAAVESSIDLANSYAWEYSERTVSSAVPLNYGWKIALFERIHRQNMPLADLRKQAAPVLKSIKSVSEDRNWLAHGCIVPNYREADGWILRKGQFNRTDGSVTFVERHFTANELVALERNIRNLTFQVARYAHAVGQRIRKDTTDDQSS